MQTTRAVAAAVALTLSSVHPALAASPSFDCAKASGQAEELVCKDDAPAALDRRMAEVYAKAEKALPAAEAAKQKTLQRGWVKGRDECWKSTDVRACVEAEYRTRIVELQIVSGQLTAPTPAGYACEGESQPVTATYYNDTDPKSAVITVGNDQVIAFVAPSGSGARYTAANVELWEHQGEATLTWFGKSLKCTVRAAPKGAGAD
jgi:uncharacterized protein